MPSRALARARGVLETERQAEALRSGSTFEIPPEYASAALFVAGEERPLADFGRNKEPLRMTPVHELAGPVPQLKRGRPDRAPQGVAACCCALSATPSGSMRALC